LSRELYLYKNKQNIEEENEAGENMDTIKIRFAVKDDIHKLTEIQMQNKNGYYMFGRQTKVMTEEDYRKDILLRMEQKSEFRGLYSVEKSSQVIGFFFLYFAIHKNGYTNLHMCMEKEYMKEYGEEILKKATAHCFYELNYNKINIQTLETDDMFLEILKNNSYNLEIVQREHFYQSGRYVDVYRFGTVKKDFINKIKYDLNTQKTQKNDAKLEIEAEYDINPGANLLTGNKIDLTLMKAEDAKTMYDQNLVSDEKNFASIAASAPDGLDYYIKKVNKPNDFLFFSDDISFAIRKKDGQIVGTIGADSIDMRNRNMMIGLSIIDKDNRGQGYGSEAIRLLLDFAFFEMNMHRVYLGCFTFNNDASKIYEHIGFVPEGTNRDFVYRNGKYYDEFTLGILKKEWIKIKEGNK